MQIDYIVKTDGHYGYKIFTDEVTAVEFANKQNSTARVFTVITKETYVNDLRNSPKKA